MNERIKALAVEADFALYEDGNFRSDPGQWINAELEKFAELIIRDCANWIKTTDSNSDIGEEDAQALLEYFGVTKSTN
jgi:hypothetical protein